MNIKNKVNRIVQILGIIRKSLSAKFILVGSPLHGNLGDQAIAIGEMEFIKEHFTKGSCVEIDGDLARKYSDSFIKFLVKNKTILIQGGGFLGDLYMREENMVRRIIELFPHNKIVIFPQTLFFKNGDVEKNNTIKIYDNHSDLSICMREQYSYDLACSMFKNIKVYLIPDMVLYLKRLDTVEKTNTCVFCMRNDKEGILNPTDVSKIKGICKQKLGVQIRETDTVLNCNVFVKDRDRCVYDKIKEFALAKYVITDRLHGMVMAYLARTEVFVFNNCNYKVRGIYSWIKENKRIHLVESVDEFEAIIETKSESEDIDVDLQSYYNQLADIIRV